uniref:WW domain-containing protein n=1 Tax=Helicotheca tamesis TaxID=374047 RepID=A0A7S2DWJ9_9STRA
MTAELQTTESDGDTWVEAKAILDESTKEMRSYFWSRNTQERVWDKPPPNAGKVVWWEQIVEYDSEQKPQHLKIVSTSSGEEKKKKNLSPLRKRNVSPKREEIIESKTPPKYHDKKKRFPLRKLVAPAPRSQSPKGDRHRHEPAKSAPPSKTTKPLTSSGDEDSKEVGPTEIKEQIASRSTPRRTTRGDGGGGIDLRDSLPPPDGGEYDYEYEENESETKDKFKAKPSTTVKSGGTKLKTKTLDDGDVWVEAQVLLNEKKGTIRSYFYSKKTKKRVWDEPPSGAGEVIYLKDVKRVYMRNKRHHWRRESNENDDKRKKAGERVSCRKVRM